MKTTPQKALVVAIALASSQASFAADSIAEMFKEAKASGNFNLRYENVDSGDDVDQLALRSRFGFTTGTYANFSAYAEVEDVTHIAGVAFPQEPALRLDREVTEIDQAFVQYKTDGFTAKVGRQVLTLDNHRFVGHVGWRQDRQTFDGVNFKVNPSKEFLLDVSYLVQRNRIFGEDLDARSDDILVNGGYNTSIGKITGYAYLLDDEARNEASDTLGVRFVGSTKGKTSFLYTAEFATQEIEAPAGSFDADYLFLEGGIKAAGVTAKLGYEVLGSDDGTASFTTPLATLHAFNGWTDIFLGGTFNPVALPLGLQDTYLTVGGKVGAFSLLANFHDYQSDEGSTDYGTEFGVQATAPLGGGFSGGLKYSSYSADDFSADTDRFWTWVSFGF